MTSGHWPVWAALTLVWLTIAFFNHDYWGAALCSLGAGIALYVHSGYPK